MKTAKFLTFFVLLGTLLFTSCDKDEATPLTIKFQKAAINMVEGDTTTLVVEGLNKGAEVTWNSSNEKIATVKDGLVTALTPGNAIISVVAKQDGKLGHAKIKLTVTPNLDKEVIKFTDAKLQAWLLAMPGLDANKDGQITRGEAKSINKIDFSFKNPQSVDPAKVITNIDGLQYFVNLDTLNLNNHPVANAEPIAKLTKLVQLQLYGSNFPTIDLSALTELQDLRITRNPKLTKLDVKNNTKLVILAVAKTGITEMDLTPLKEIETVGLNDNKLTSVKFSNLPKLDRIDIFGNKLTAIEASGCPMLKQMFANKNAISSVVLKDMPELFNLVLYENKITQIDLNLPKLMMLRLNDNAIANIDLSNVPNLMICDLFNNPLVKADFSKNPVIRDIVLNDCPNLQEINICNKGYNPEAEYTFFYGNTQLKTIYVDKGDEETHVQNLAKYAKRTDVKIIAQ